MYLCIFKSHTILFDSHMTILYNKDKEAKVTGYDGKKGTDLNVIRFLNRGFAVRRERPGAFSGFAAYRAFRAYSAKLGQT